MHVATAGGSVASRFVAVQPLPTAVQTSKVKRMSNGSEPASADSHALSADQLAAWVDNLTSVDTNAPDAALIDQISQLERLKSACAAAQAALTVAFVTSQVEGLSPAKARDEHAHRSIAAQVALARKESPARGNRLVGLAKALTREMPNTFAALQAGELSEWRATLITRETACLTVEHRRQVDAELAGKLSGLGDKGVGHAAARIAQRLDPASIVARNRKAIGERRVSIRPAPDTMAYLTALLPVAQGIAAWAALSKFADCAKATGDPRGRGQLMADQFVIRLTTPGAAAGATAAPRAGTDPSAPAGRDATGKPADVAAPATTSTAANGAGTNTCTGPADPTQPRATADRNENGSTAAASGRGGSAPDTAPPAPDTTPTPPAPTPGCAPNLGDVTPAPSTGDDESLASESDPSDPTAAPTIPAGVGLDIQLVMTDRTLFDGDDEPAHLTGYGPIPAALARRLVREAEPGIKAWIRRLYTDPDTGHLITGDTRRRDFNHSQRQFLVARDQTCRSAYCDAPIRHSDHVTGHVNNGPTDIKDGQGLCANCNYLKAMAGWSSRVEPNGHTIMTTTPTGHTHRSDPPRPPTSPPWQQVPPRPDVSFVEARLRRILEVA